jgi:hypothetical protein
MAKVWFVGEQYGGGVSARQAYDLPFTEAIKVLELTKNSWICDLSKRPLVPSGSDFGRNQQVSIEVTDDEINAMSGWESGFYRSSLSTEEADKRLREMGAKPLNPFPDP